MKFPLAFRHDLDEARAIAARHERVAANRLALLGAREDQLLTASSERDAAVGELQNAKQNIVALNAAHAAELDSLKRIIWGEKQMRKAAQRGLVPYVRGLEALDQWLLDHPELREALHPILQEQGLWEIKLGYDPDADFGDSVAAVNRA